MSNNPQQLHTPQQLEEIAINQAMKNAHKNPRTDSAQQNCLNADGLNRKIETYKIIPVDSLITNNPRFDDIDVSYNKTDLAPLMVSKLAREPDSLGFDYPIFVERRGNKYEIIHGHNRYWCAVNVLHLTEVPVFVIETKGSQAQKLRGRILANSRLPGYNRPYKMNDVIQQMKELKIAGAFPNFDDETKTRQDFEREMNKLHPEQFTSEIARGKIFKGFYESDTSNTSVVPTDDSYWDSALSRNNYPSRFLQMAEGKRKKIKFPHFIDEAKKAIIIYAADNSNIFQVNIFNFIEEFLTNQDYKEQYADYAIHLLVSIRPNKDFPTTVMELNKLRKKLVEDSIDSWNIVLDSANTPRIEKVIFPKQLTIEASDRIFNYDPTDKKLKV